MPLPPPRSASSRLWKKVPGRPAMVEEQFAVLWRLAGLRVISGVDDMKSPVTGEPTPTWHVSASRIGGVVSDSDLDMVRKAFGMEQAEEDNHEPGRARHLFLAVDPAHRADCECNIKEQTFIEPNGHRWKAPADAEVNRRAAMDLVWGNTR